MSQQALDNPEPQPAPSPSLNQEEVKERAVSGVKHLGMRTALSLVLRTVNTLTLARLLIAEDYGLFGIVASIAGLGMYLGDFGVGMVMVRQKESPSRDELSTVFWFQQAITTFIVVAILLLSPLLLAVYKLQHSTLPLIIVMAMGLYLSSLRTIAAINLERVLRFDLIARAEMVENVALTVITVGSAIAGLGVWALVLGNVLSRAIGLVMLWRFSPWRPIFVMRRHILKQILPQSTGFQAIVVAPVLITSAIPVLIQNYRGLQVLGYFNWSNNLASVVGQLNSVLCRVALPAFSRIQDEPEALGRTGRNAVARITLLLHLVVVPGIFLIPVILPLIFGHKWNNAIPLVRWSLLDAVVMCGVNVFAQVLNVGKRLAQAGVVAVVGGLLRLVLIGVSAYFLPLDYLMVASYTVAIAELVMEAYIVERHIPGGRGALAQTVTPSLVFGATVACALVIETYVKNQGGGIASAVGLNLLMFLVVCVLYNFLMKGQPIKTELVRAWGMLLKRRI